MAKKSPNDMSSEFVTNFDDFMSTFLSRACYYLGLKSHPIPYRGRSAIVRCDRDDSIPNDDWSVLANNLNQAFLNLSIFSDF